MIFSLRNLLLICFFRIGELSNVELFMMLEMGGETIIIKIRFGDITV